MNTVPPLIGRDLPQWVRDLLACPPVPGEGKLDDWVYRTARGLCPYRDDAEIIALLTACAPTEAAKIVRVMSNARRNAWQPNAIVDGGYAPFLKKRIKPDLDLITAVVEDGSTALQLWERSPRYLGADDGSNCEEIVLALLADAVVPDPLLCIGQSVDEFATRPLSFWLTRKRLADYALIVPAHMTARNGHTKEGKVSEHTAGAILSSPVL